MFELSEAVLESLPVAVLQVDQENRIQFANAYASQLLFCPNNKIFGFHINQVLLLEPALGSYCTKAVKDGKTFHFYQQEVQRNAIAPLIADFEIAPLYQDGNREGSVIVFWATSKEKDSDDPSKESSKVEPLSLLVSSVAHEIQNPLAGVKGATQLLKRELKNNPISTPYLDIILKELGRIDRLVRSLLLHSKEVPLELNDLNVHSILDDILFFQRQNSKKVKIAKDYDPSLPSVYADRDKLHQVILNIIKNAVEASPEGSRIDVITRFGSAWNTPRKIKQANYRYVYLEIQDNGGGISKEIRNKIFAPFFTTKKDGNGVGLSISYRLMKEQKGALQLIDSPEGTTRFRIWIPVRLK
ncbi:MAG: two-component system nitrogen regulation sensor histidine kinase GlnL [bacterium]|jgi:two-component system nitrogen regulation sensor histidine kinase GlnL